MGGCGCVVALEGLDEGEWFDSGKNDFWSMKRCARGYRRGFRERWHPCSSVRPRIARNCEG